MNLLITYSKPDSKHLQGEHGSAAHLRGFVLGPGQSRGQRGPEAQARRFEEAGKGQGGAIFSEGPAEEEGADGGREEASCKEVRLSSDAPGEFLEMMRSPGHGRGCPHRGCVCACCLRGGFGVAGFPSSAVVRVAVLSRRQILQPLAGDTMAGASKPRSAMQQWVPFPLYLPEAVWQQALAPHQSAVGSAEVLIDHLFRMGLRHPSEATQAMMVACTVYREKDAEKRTRLLEGAHLRSVFLNVKALYKSKIARARLPALSDAYLVDLPSNLDSAPESLKALCFGEASPTPCMPCSFEELLDIVQRVPQRSSNAALKGSGKGWVADGSFMGHQMMTQLLQGMAMAAWAMGPHRAPAEALPVTDLRPQAKALALLRLVDGHSGAASSSPQPPVPLPAAAASTLALCNAPATAAPSVEKVETAASCLAEPSQNLETSFKIADAVREPLLSEQVQKHGQEEGAEMPQHAEPVDQMEKKEAQQSRPKKLSLLQSLGMMNEARSGAAASSVDKEEEPVVKKRPAAASKGAVMKKPASKPKAALKRPAAKEAEDRVTRKRRMLIEAGVPRSLMQQFSHGCSSCRNAALCTPSCWAKRGYAL